MFDCGGAHKYSSLLKSKVMAITEKVVSPYLGANEMGAQETNRSSQ